MSAEAPVVVVGAGLAGLSCAVRLQREGVRVVVLEAEDAVGGRIRTDVVDGFTIDRGFQVLNTAYPALRGAVDLQALELRRLPRGVRVRRGGDVHTVPHPLSSPAAPVRALSSRVVGAREKLAMVRYAGSIVASSPGALKRRRDVSASVAWADLPEDLVTKLLVPFLRGVVLEEEITTSRVFTDLMMRMFATGSSAVPARGMQALPEQIASRLGPAIRLGVPVAQVGASEVRLRDGEVMDARAVVVATDPWTAHRLVPELGTPPTARGVTTHYFATDPWPGVDGTLVVDADGSGIVNSVVLTASAPEYSGDGRALIATSVLGADGDLRPDDVARVARALHEAPATSWEHITTREIAQALPAMPAPHVLRKPSYQSQTGVWVAGDHRDTSSIQGALVSGERAATSVLSLLPTDRRLPRSVR